jgi:hypothetical protein
LCRATPTPDLRSRVDAVSGSLRGALNTHPLQQMVSVRYRNSCRAVNTPRSLTRPAFRNHKRHDRREPPRHLVVGGAGSRFRAAGEMHREQSEHVALAVLGAAYARLLASGTCHRRTGQFSFDECVPDRAHVMRVVSASARAARLRSCVSDDGSAGPVGCWRSSRSIGNAV